MSRGMATAGGPSSPYGLPPRTDLVKNRTSEAGTTRSSPDVNQTEQSRGSWRGRLCLPAPDLAQKGAGLAPSGVSGHWLLVRTGLSREGAFGGPEAPTRRSPLPPHLQVAGGGGAVDLDVAVVGAGQQLSVSEPRDRGTGVGKHLAGDVHLVPLPGVHGHGALQLGGIWNEQQRLSGGRPRPWSPAHPASAAQGVAEVGPGGPSRERVVRPRPCRLAGTPGTV